MGAENNHLAFGYFGLFFNENRAALGEFLDHVFVVHDFLAHVDRSAVLLEGALDRLDSTIDTGAVTTGRCQNHLFRTCCDG